MPPADDGLRSPTQGATLPPLSAVSAHVEALAGRGAERRYRRGTLIIQDGERGDTLYIVRSGRLRAFVADAGGKELTLGLYGPGEYVGEMSLDGGPRSASVEAVEPTVCALIQRDDLLAYIAEQPAFALELMARLIRRARMATENARSMALVDVYGRLTRLLDQLADPPDANGARPLRERLTHQQIAHHLACSREMVSRLLKDLEHGGYVAQRERRLVLLKTLPARW
ncbi:Crp/Fnr family transcriptional regulator [Ottowia testudinis]|uniref:Crp/Fnr family transcriptional regulator n=1 Tax=Ottowia testudinis TaxID=2816950 RepID=A0A975CFB5_9BURK|nr:Crp/Fnr family transcriptional regulator [Ottowia testudinis]QTD45175.1 Crp/Fnr family transcriptional regulator [Ottowia testudinis]